MDFGTLLYQLKPDERTLVRKTQNMLCKKNNADLAVDFNTTHTHTHTHTHTQILLEMCVISINIILALL